MSWVSGWTWPFEEMLFEMFSWILRLSHEHHSWSSSCSLHVTVTYSSNSSINCFVQSIAFKLDTMVVHATYYHLLYTYHNSNIFQMNKTQWTWINQLSCIPNTPAAAGWSILTLLSILIIIGAVSTIGFFAYTKFIKQRNYFSTESTDRSNLSDSSNTFGDS